MSVALQQTRIADQLRRVESYLHAARASNPSWLLVAHHYPVYSAGSHGDTAEMVSHLAPLLEKVRLPLSYTSIYPRDIYISLYLHITPVGVCWRRTARACASAAWTRVKVSRLRPEPLPWPWPLVWRGRVQFRALTLTLTLP